MGLLTIVGQKKAHACDRLPRDIRTRALLSYAVHILDTVVQP
jgi:hypothetical protein